MGLVECGWWKGARFVGGGGLVPRGGSGGVDGSGRCGVMGTERLCVSTQCLFSEFPKRRVMSREVAGGNLLKFADNS